MNVGSLAHTIVVAMVAMTSFGSSERTDHAARASTLTCLPAAAPST